MKGEKKRKEKKKSFHQLNRKHPKKSMKRRRKRREEEKEKGKEREVSKRGWVIIGKKKRGEKEKNFSLEGRVGVKVVADNKLSNIKHEVESL